MVNHIIDQGLIDAEFVSEQVHGWEAFCSRAKDYPLEWAAEKTGLTAGEIQLAAEMFATEGPAGIHWGVALEQSINCVNNISLLISLMAMTGNIDRPGGNVFYPNPPVVNASQLGRHRNLSPEMKAKRLGCDRFRLADVIGVINPKVVWDAILTEDPYPVRGLYLISTNPVITRGNAKEVRAALLAVDFLVVQDFFMTPSAALADVVLPAATWLEHDYVGDLWKRHGWVIARNRAVSVGQSRSDYDILNELGKRCTEPQYWWPSMSEALEDILAPAGLTWEQFAKRGYLQGERKFKKYREGGFRTPTRKVELYSTVMERLGYDPLPGFNEPLEAPWSNPETAKFYPYQLITGARIPVFFHSENRQPGFLRSRHPHPRVELHPKLAATKGIATGDWVRISSPRGSILQQAFVTDRVTEGVVAAEHGWWFPEDENELGWDRSNIDLLTDNAYESCDPAMGATSLRTLLCNVEKV